MSASGVRVKESSSTTSWCSEKTQERRDPAPSDSALLHNSIVVDPIVAIANHGDEVAERTPILLCKSSKGSPSLATFPNEEQERLGDEQQPKQSPTAGFSVPRPKPKKGGRNKPEENADLYCGDEDYDSDWENENSGLSGLIRREILPKYFYMGGNYFVTHDTEASDTDENVLFAYGRRGEV
eukprot:CAMPEP_0172373318 /NCGR_PEP_ID=MMETSP1060-20121228/51156_1 /TAXON_ID=37318 /ORGANISM="Pseudo-nitzschia pungens, Strain cf. cingulata" /LENGTH=181 /DNA_ID=CAMNT_0013099617 /DNA_START=79 /DNA_END=624 /DNA_ORIENTATION=-